MRLDAIPSWDTPPETGAAPSKVKERAPRSASRRTIMKGLAVGAMAATLAPFDWVLSKRAAHAVGPTSEWGSCRIYTSEMSNNWWSNGYAACVGGWRRGSYPCNSNDRHKEGTYGNPGIDEAYSSYRITSCDGRNAWLWTHASSGNVYRCSDATTRTTFYPAGTSRTDLTIARCYLYG